MSFNGSGTFVVNSAGQPVVANTVISATVFNALTADLATGLSTCITKDGQTTVTANIPFGNNKITALGAGTAASDAANLGQVQSTAAKLVTVTGTDTITGTMSPALTAYAAGQLFYFIANAANTGAVTINIDGLGAKSITRDGSTALAAGDINSGEVVVVVYDGTRFQMINAANSFGNTTINGTLTVTGNTALQANVSITSTLSVGGTFAVTGAATLGSTLAVTGKSDLPTVSTASINAAVALITTGTVTNLTASGASIASANIGNLQFTAASIASINAGVAVVTNLTATSASIASMNAGVALLTTATVTSLTATGASVASANVGTAVVTGLTVTGASIASVNAGTATLSGNLTLNGGTANGVLYLNGSKVATSGSALSFNGTTLTAPQMTLTSANGITMNSASGGLIDCSGNTLFIQFPSSNSLIFRQSGSPFTEYMRLTSTGLGIGTTSPGAKLTVSDASTGALIRVASDTNGSNRGFQWFNNGNSALFGSILSNYTTGILTYDSGGAAYAGFHAWSLGTSGEAMRLNTTGLGIGTTSPASKLDVRNTGGTYDKGISIQTASAGNIGTIWTSLADLNIGIAGAHKFTNYDGSATRMTLDSSGNLGLGVTPSAWTSAFGPVIQVKAATGGGALTGSSADNFRMFANTFYDGAYKRIGAGYATQYEQAAGQHSWYTAGTSTANSSITFTQAMTLDASGRLGIGYTTPANKLDISEAGNTQAINIRDSSSSNFSVFGITPGTYNGGTNKIEAINTTNLNIVTNGSTYIALGTNGTEKARITAAGNLGVGTSSPTEKLHVAGNVRINDCVQYTKTASNADLSTTITFNAGSSIYYPVAVEILVSRVNNAAPQGTSIILINARELNGTLSNQSSTTVSSAGDAVTVTLSVSGAALTITLDTDTGGVSKAVAFFKVISYNGVASIT
jgi:hypothetical protein